MTYEPPPIEHHPCADTRGGGVRLRHTYDLRGTGECVDCGDVCLHFNDTCIDGEWTCLDCNHKEKA